MNAFFRWITGTAQNETELSNRQYMVTQLQGMGMTIAEAKSFIDENVVLFTQDGRPVFSNTDGLAVWMGVDQVRVPAGQFPHNWEQDYYYQSAGYDTVTYDEEGRDWHGGAGSHIKPWFDKATIARWKAGQKFTAFPLGWVN